MGLNRRDALTAMETFSLRETFRQANSLHSLFLLQFGSSPAYFLRSWVHHFSQGFLSTHERNIGLQGPLR